jgi:hypothetical protein
VFGCGVALILLLWAIVAMRAGRIRSLFEQGREVEANVRKVTHFRGARTKLALEFELNGVPHKVSFVFLRWSKTPRFDEGARIPLLVDPTKPNRVVAPAVYERPGPPTAIV